MRYPKGKKRIEIWSMLVKWLDENNTNSMDSREVMLLFAEYYSDLKLRELKDLLFELIMEP